MTTKKRCTFCCRLLSLDRFYERAPGKRRARCADCCSLSTQEQRDPEAFREYQRTYMRRRRALSKD